MRTLNATDRRRPDNHPPRKVVKMHRVSIDTATADIERVTTRGAVEIHLYDLAALAHTQPARVHAVLSLTNRLAKQATRLRRATD